jgi:hypothetical protein
VTGASGFDALELFSALGRHEVQYVTVGGVAIQAYGGQRMTQDLDVVIAASRENIDARILGRDGQRSKSVPSAAMLASGDQWHLITEHGPLDVRTLPAHLGSFADVRGRAHVVQLGELSIPIAHRDDLLRMKRAAGRPQDLADVRLLESLGDEP